MGSSPARSLRMRPYIVETKLFAFDGEVESPASVHATLPEIERLIVLLGAQRWMMEVFEEQSALFVEGFPNFRWRRGVLLQEALRIADPHLGADLRALFFDPCVADSLWSEVTRSRWLSKGPYARPSRKSARLS